MQKNWFVCQFSGCATGSQSPNKTPKGIMRSAVPLPCLFDVVKSQNVAGQRPQQGTKSCRMGRNSIRPSIHPFVHLTIRSAIHPRGLRTSGRGLRASRQGLRASQRGGGWTGGRTDGRTDGRNFSPFYRTSSPVGAAALLPSETETQHQRSRAREPLTS